MAPPSTEMLAGVGDSLVKARKVREQDAEKVKVRRLLEAVSSTECGPSRGVCLGLGSVDP